jgi:site-specific recombinase XerD
MLVVSGSLFADICNKAIVLILLDTGKWLAELASLKMEDISAECDILVVYGKSGKERMVCIGLATQKAFSKYLMLMGDATGTVL